MNSLTKQERNLFGECQGQEAIHLGRIEGGGASRGKEVYVDFDGGNISSDGGLLLLKESEPKKLYHPVG